MMTQAPRAAAPVRQSPTRLMLLWSLPATFAVALVGGAIGYAVGGPAMAWSALVGGVLGLVIFALGMVAIRGVLSGPNQIVMAAAFFVLLVQLALTAGVLFLLSGQDWVSMMALALALVAAGLVFQVGAVIGALRARVTVAPGAAPASASVAPDHKETRR